MSFAESLTDPLEESVAAPRLAKRTSRASVWFVVAMGFAINIEYSIGMPTIFHYVDSLGGSTADLGISLALFPLASTLLYVPMGIWSDVRSMRELFIATLLLGIVGNLCYGAAGRAGHLWLVSLGRFLTGVSAANRSLTRPYIARCVERGDQTFFIAMQMSFNLLAVLIGPVLCLATAPLNWKWGWFELDSDTAPGYICAITNFLLLVGVFTVFEEPPASDVENVFVALWRDSRQLHRVKEEAKRVLVQWAGWWNLYNAFATSFLIASLEAFVTPMTDVYGFGPVENSTLFSTFALSGCVGVVAAIRLERKGVSPRRVSLFGAGLCVVAVATMTITHGAGTPKLWSAACVLGIAAGWVLCLGCLVAAVTSSSRYTKIIGEGPQGFFGALVNLCMGVAKIVGPLLVGFALEPHIGGPGNWLLFVLLLIPATTNILGIGCTWARQGVPSDAAMAFKGLDEEELSRDLTQDLTQSLLGTAD